MSLTSIRRFTAVLIAAGALAAPAAQAAGPVQDLRSPDARTPFEAPVVQDLRSPDARTPFEAPVVHDLGSPRTAATPSPGTSPWPYVAGGVALTVLAGAALLATTRRRRRALAGS